MDVPLGMAHIKCEKCGYQWTKDIQSNEGCPACPPTAPGNSETEKLGIVIHDNALKGQPNRQWQPIETADRLLGSILIYVPGSSRPVKEAWWKMPYEGARPEQCGWQTMDGACLSADVHKSLDGKPLGATHWMPLPEPPAR